jgi:diapolycopene oxygenase
MKENTMKKMAVIGAGLGGISAAITLAKEKHFDVTLYEKNDHLGGKLNQKSQDGFRFDLGPSILTMPHLFDRLFKMHGKKREDYVTFEKVNPHWRNFFEDGTKIDLLENVDDMVNEKALTAKDLTELKNFLTYTRRLYNATEKIYFDNQSETVRDTMKFFKPSQVLGDTDLLSTMDQGVRRYVKNPHMVQILNFFAKYVGTSPYHAPAILNLLPFIQWEFGLWYVKGGLFKLSEALEKLASEVGVKIETGAEITNVVKSDGLIDAIEINGSKIVEVDGIVSNMEVVPFYRFVSKESEKVVGKIEHKFGPAASGFALHLGLNRTYDQLAHHNFFYSAHPKDHYNSIFKKAELFEDPTIYLVAAGKTDPSVAPEGHENIKILPHIPVVQDEPFTQEDYALYKDKILQKLERMGLTDIRKHIVTEELWTPETIQQMYYSNRGAIYGVDSHKRINRGFKNKKHSALYDNLYFVGGSVNPGGGMPMVVLSGQQVKDQILKNPRFHK